MNIGYFILVFCLAYIITTLVGIAHTIFNWKVLKMENKVEKITTMYDVVAYAKTVPFHPLYNIIIWPVFSYFYLHMVNPVNVWRDAFVLGAAWTLITIIIDLFGWVIIKHPWRMTFKEMYLDYQPWISLIYLAIFVSPFIAAIFLR
jgi:hypothetical protein